MERAQAALLLAGGLWLAGVAPDAPPASACQPSVAAQARCAAAAQAEPTSLLFGGRIDLNRAEPASLEVLPGIGPARAAAIVEERCRAAFASVAAVERVPGIGPRTRAALEAFAWASAPCAPRAGCAQEVGSGSAGGASSSPQPNTSWETDQRRVWAAAPCPRTSRRTAARSCGRFASAGSRRR